jgi:hypothetical protein
MQHCYAKIVYTHHHLQCIDRNKSRCSMKLDTYYLTLPLCMKIFYFVLHILCLFVFVPHYASAQTFYYFSFPETAGYYPSSYNQSTPETNTATIIQGNTSSIVSPLSSNEAFYIIRGNEASATTDLSSIYEPTLILGNSLSSFSSPYRIEANNYTFDNTWGQYTNTPFEGGYSPYASVTGYDPYTSLFQNVPQQQASQNQTYQSWDTQGYCYASYCPSSTTFYESESQWASHPQTDTSYYYPSITNANTYFEPSTYTDTYSSYTPSSYTPWDSSGNCYASYCPTWDTSDYYYIGY